MIVKAMREKNRTIIPSPKHNLNPLKRALLPVSWLLLFSISIQSQPALSDSLENLFSNTKNTSVQLSLLHQLAETYSETNLDLALEKTGLGLELSHKMENEKEAAEFLSQRVNILQMMSKYYSAILDFDAAKAIFKKENAFEKYAEALERKSNTYLNQGQFDKAVATYMEALAVWEQLENDAGVANIYVCLSDAFYYQERPEQGIEYGEQAIAIFKKIKDEEGLANAYQNTGGNYCWLMIMRRRLA